MKDAEATRADLIASSRALAASQDELRDRALSETSAASRVLTAIQDELVEAMWKEAAASESALPRAQEEPIASRLNEAIVRAFIRAATHARYGRS